MSLAVNLLPGLALLGAYAAAAGLAIWLGARTRVKAQNADWLSHVSDFRRRLLVSVAAILGVALAMFSFSYQGGVIRPSLHDSVASQIFSAVRNDLLPPEVQLVVVRPIDGFLAQMTLAVGISAIVTAPVWVSQIAGFILPALKANERRAIRNAVAPVAALFLLGAAFAYIYVIPFLLRTLYGYGTALGAQPLLQVSEFVGFTVGMVLVMGAAFQTPVVMTVLTRTGLVAAQTWRRGWRIAIVAILILSALVTDPTIVSQLLVAAPLMLLYVIGAIAASVKPASRSEPA